MTASIFDETLFPAGGPTSRPGWGICIPFVIALIALPCRGQTSKRGDLPKVLMVEYQSSDSPSSGLYKAIRAQLSASPLILERALLAPEPGAGFDPARSAPLLARAHGAALVFWIDVQEPCRMYFYIGDESGGDISSRAIDVDLNSQSSRFEVIAVVASSMIEGLLISRNLNTKALHEGQNPPPAPTDKAPTRERRWLESFAAYSGSFLAPEAVSHGGTLGLGLLPIDRLVVAVSFTQNLPERFSSDELRLEVVSRELEVLTAGRVLLRPVDVRLGGAWSVDLRSYSTTSLSEEIDARKDGFLGVHSLVLFLHAAWTYRDRIGVFGRLGARLALNETVYRINRDGGPTRAFEPFVTKLFYQIGVVVRI